MSDNVPPFQHRVCRACYAVEHPIDNHPWSNDIMLVLLAAWYTRPCLYNSADPNFNNLAARNEAMEGILQELLHHIPNMTMPELRNRLCRIRFFYMCLSWIKLMISLIGMNLGVSQPQDWIFQLDGFLGACIHQPPHFPYCANGFEEVNGQNQHSVPVAQVIGLPPPVFHVPRADAMLIPPAMINTTRESRRRPVPLFSVPLNNDAMPMPRLPSTSRTSRMPRQLRTNRVPPMPRTGMLHMAPPGTSSMPNLFVPFEQIDSRWAVPAPRNYEQPTGQLLTGVATSQRAHRLPITTPRSAAMPSTSAATATGYQRPTSLRPSSSPIDLSIRQNRQNQTLEQLLEPFRMPSEATFRPQVYAPSIFEHRAFEQLAYDPPAYQVPTSDPPPYRPPGSSPHAAETGPSDEAVQDNATGDEPEGTAAGSNDDADKSPEQAAKRRRLY